MSEGPSRDELRQGIENRLNVIEAELADMCPGHEAQAAAVAGALFDAVLLMISVHESRLHTKGDDRE